MELSEAQADLLSRLGAKRASESGRAGESEGRELPNYITAPFQIHDCGWDLSGVSSSAAAAAAADDPYGGALEGRTALEVFTELLCDRTSMILLPWYESVCDANES